MALTDPDPDPRSTAPDKADRFDLSVVTPARNECGNLTPLVAEIQDAFAGSALRIQIVVVDDGSTDGTAKELVTLLAEHPNLRVLKHELPLGQSLSLHAGFAAASALLVATLDADLQNDPADLPRMVRRLQNERADLVQGDRTANRRDHFARRSASAVGRWARRVIVGDRVRDTGCATRVMRRTFAVRLPLDRPGMHRFIPACVAGLGGRVIETPVNHRPRHAGKTKYGTGLIKRGLPGLRDCFVVRGLIRRERARTPADVPGASQLKPAQL
ncbi:MAG: glycosyltransferase family 2 protein [Planctomycetota bacterium]